MISPPTDAALPPEPGGTAEPDTARTDTVRVRIDLAYQGTQFAGWARQPNERTVEGEFSVALATIARVPSVKLVVAGRTDAGVHAQTQVIHTDLDRDAWSAIPGRAEMSPSESLIRRLNGLLPTDIVVHRALEAPAEFDARFSAVSRTYTYRIADTFAARAPLRRHDTWFSPGTLDDEAMARASAMLLGEHDWVALYKPRPGASTVRTLQEFSWKRNDAGVLVATVRADAFCHRMVRHLVGAVVTVGSGKRPVTWPAELLASRRKDPFAVVVPAHGLTLVDIQYPPDEQFAATASLRRGFRELAS